MSSLVAQATDVNPQNSHFKDPLLSSRVGAASGCGGSVTSPDALKQSGMYEVVKVGGKKRSPKSCNCYCHKCTCKGRCPRNCKCPCHGRRCARNCNCICHNQRGGNGYGFSKDQSLASTSGVNSVNGSVHLGGFDSYQNVGVNSDTNMGASSQKGGYGTGGIPYYGYSPVDESLSTFAGSGYPPITKGLNSQCPPPLTGGRKTRRRKGRKMRKTYKKKAIKRTRNNKKVRRRKTRRVKVQRGGYSQYMSNVANSPTYSTGAPPMLSAKESMLANPVPYTPKNECLNTWKHLGDMPPFNEVFK